MSPAGLKPAKECANNAQLQLQITDPSPHQRGCPIIKKTCHCLKIISLEEKEEFVKFEVFTAVTIKNAIFWNVTSCGSCKNQHFGGMYRLHHLGDKIR
jgi:hypothetical protein